MNFKQLIAKYASGNLSSNQVPEISYIAFEEGYDCPSLYILAGLEKDEGLYTMDKYLQLSLGELEIVMPDKRIATLQYANALADEVINGKKDLIAGVTEIVRVIKSYDFFSETQFYVYDSIFFEHVYGLYDSYDDLIDAIVDWSKDKSNQELMDDIKIELLVELKLWNGKMITYLNQ